VDPVFDLIELGDAIGRFSGQRRFHSLI
jgi:hypothetical protein